MTNVATVTADIDLGNDDGLFMARMFAAFAAKESGRRSARVRRKMQANAAAGLPHGGSLRPFGYDETRMAVVEREAAIIRQLADGSSPVSRCGRWRPGWRTAGVHGGRQAVAHTTLTTMLASAGSPACVSTTA